MSPVSNVAGFAGNSFGTNAGKKDSVAKPTPLNLERRLSFYLHEKCVMLMFDDRLHDVAESFSNSLHYKLANS